MTDLEVWAPRAAKVELVVRKGRYAAAPVGHGWYRVDAPLSPGDDYAWSLDGGQPRPDPRSPCQPVGVEGPSRLVDHSAFRWTDAAWSGRRITDTVIYELHVGTFSAEGTFDGVIGHLDHLVDLGVGTVELMPVAEFPGRRGWGYDGVGLFAPHVAYGGPAGLKRLVDACHNRGLAVVLDVVYNHLGPAGNHLREFGPYFTDRYRTPWGEAVNFDGPDSDPVRGFVVDNALMWLRDYHLDGLRLDAVHAVYDMSALSIFEELATEVDALEEELGRPLTLIAESDLNDPRVVTPRDRGGWGLDAQWSDDFHHALHALLTGERTGYYADFGTVAQLAKAIRQAYVYDGGWSAHRRRRHGRPAVGLPPSRFLAYLQNHDQVGNRAKGERSSALVRPGQLRLAAALVLLGPCVPMLFQGEEWAAATPFLYFTDHDDPALGRAVSEGRRQEFAAFGWDPAEVPDPQDPKTFEQSVLDWSEPAEPGHAEILDWHRRLIRLRRSVPDLAVASLPGPTSVRHDDRARWLVVERGSVSIACNFGSDRARIPVAGMGPVTVLLDSSRQLEVSSTAVTLDGESVAVVGSV